MPRRTAKERFFERVKLGPNGCWLWRGYINRSGYGTMSYAGSPGRLAHRVAYMEFVGPVPDGLLVCHRCDVTACVNPAHLFLGTDADNAADRNRKGRTARGERGGKTKLTEAQVREIRDLVASGLRHREVAARFNIGLSTVGHICGRYLWAHVS